MDRNFLAHRGGDAINAVLAAAGYNFRRLIAWLAIFLRARLAAIIATAIPPLDQGLTPSRALAAMLSWVAEESTRLRDAAVD